MIPRVFRPILDWEKRGHFSFSLFAADGVLAAWLLFAQRAFLGLSLPSSHTLAKFAVGVAVLAWCARLHATTGGKLRWLPAQAWASRPQQGKAHRTEGNEIQSPPFRRWA